MAYRPPPGTADGRPVAAGSSDRLVSIAVLTACRWAAEEFLRDHASRHEAGIRIGLLVIIDRQQTWRELPAMLRRRARLRGASSLIEYAHHRAWWKVSRRSEQSGPDPAELVGEPCDRLRVTTSNDPRVAETLARSDCRLAVVIGSDVIRAQTLRSLTKRLYNVHLGDPGFHRGQPAAFWEILADQDEVRPSLHEVSEILDGGPIVVRERVPIAWNQTLEETLAATRRRLSKATAKLIQRGISEILSGDAHFQPGGTGPLHTIPTMREIRAARRVCRRRAGMQR